MVNGLQMGLPELEESAGVASLLAPSGIPPDFRGAYHLPVFIGEWSLARKPEPSFLWL